MEAAGDWYRFAIRRSLSALPSSQWPACIGYIRFTILFYYLLIVKCDQLVSICNQTVPQCFAYQSVASLHWLHLFYFSPLHYNMFLLFLLFFLFLLFVKFDQLVSICDQTVLSALLTSGGLAPLKTHSEEKPNSDYASSYGEKPNKCNQSDFASS